MILLCRTQLSKDPGHYKVEYQSTSPQRNSAKPAVNLAKYHFISHIMTLDVDCPIQLWSKMLQQIEGKVNILHILQKNNKLTTYEELNGQ
jgi:hypothetical protein